MSSGRAGATPRSQLPLYLRGPAAGGGGRVADVRSPRAIAPQAPDAAPQSTTWSRFLAPRTATVQSEHSSARRSAIAVGLTWHSIGGLRYLPTVKSTLCSTQVFVLTHSDAFPRELDSTPNQTVFIFPSGSAETQKCYPSPTPKTTNQLRFE